MIIWMFGYMAVWMYGRMVVWLYGDSIHTHNVIRNVWHVYTYIYICVHIILQAQPLWERKYNVIAEVHTVAGNGSG